MTQQEVAQELIWAGLGEMTKPTAEVREFEAYGGDMLRLNVAHVGPLGNLKLLDHGMKKLYHANPANSDEIHELLASYGHNA